jgi:RHS repeat-associated protein
LQKIVDAGGRTVWSATYDSFGRIQVQVSEIENNLRFPGQYYDQETGLHYNFHRYYEPGVGRYMTEDLIDLRDGLNRFFYANANPQVIIDPFGLFSDHGTLSTEAFNTENCDKLASDAMTWTNLVDWLKDSQDPQNAHWHAMRNDDTESVEEAEKGTDQYIDEQLSKCNAEGLGRALHAEQDKWAAGHRGYQPWYKDSKRIRHWWKDATGGGQDDAIAASVRLIKKFKEVCPCACGK